MTRRAAIAVAGATLLAIGAGAYWLFAHADVSTRAVCVDGQVCTEYFSLKGGLPVRSVCPSEGGERYPLSGPCTRVEREPAVGTVLHVRAGATAETTLVVIPKAFGVLWVETRAAARPGKRVALIGGESIRVGRKPQLSPTTGPLIELGTVAIASPVELAVEVDVPPLVEPGPYETQLNWTVADTAPERINQNPVVFVIEVAP